MRRILPLLLLLAISTASATGVLNMLLGSGGALAPSTFVIDFSDGSDGAGGTGYGYWPAHSIGSVVSQTINFGTSATVSSAYTQITSGSVELTVLAISTSSNPGQSAFATMSIKINSSPYVFNSSTASYSYSGGVATWTWNPSPNVGWQGGTAPADYTVTLQ